MKPVRVKTNKRILREFQPLSLDLAEEKKIEQILFKGIFNF